MSKTYQRKLKYQLRYFIRDVSLKDMLVDFDPNGDIALKQKISLLSYSTVLFFCLGIGALIFNYFSNYDDLFYLLGGAFLLISILSIFSGHFKNKNAFFRFSPVSQIITYSNSAIGSKPIQFETNRFNRWWCEIHEYRTRNGRWSYSTTFYHQNTENPDEKGIALNYHSYYRSDCIKVGKALNRYLEEMTELKDIKLIEK